MSEQSLKESFGTLSETINGLIKLGYTHDFNVKGECIVCQQKNVTLPPDNFQIDKVYRFEGATDPDDQAILYAISSDKHEMKGTLVNGYGISSNAEVAKLVERLESNRGQKMEGSTTISSIAQQASEHLSKNPLVEMNLNALIEQIKGEDSWKEGDRGSMVLFKSDTMRIVLIGLHGNAELTPHKASGVISVQVLEGKINFYAGEQESILEKGQMIALQENVVHGVMALKESFFLLTLAIGRK